MRFLMSLALACSVLASVGCGFMDSLDQKSKDEPEWVFRMFWDNGTTRKAGAEDPANPGFDKDGNVLVPPEVPATYSFPKIVSGFAVPVNRPKVTPVVGAQIFDAKVPYVRWLDGQVFAGYQMAGFALNKRWTSIYEISTGVFVAYDLDRHKDSGLLYGVDVALIKF